MKRLFSALALTLALATPAAALTIDYENINGTRPATNGYGLGYNYNIGFIDDALRVDVDVMLYGATQGIDRLKNLWKTGIESTWSTTDRFAVPILFNVDFVTEGWGYPVTVFEGYGRWTTHTWYTGSSDLEQQRSAAHEYGHYISLFDQYHSGGLDPNNPTISYNGLMGYGYETLDYYYEPFLNWYEAKLDLYGGDDAAPVPEPSTWAMLAMGLAAAVSMKRKQVA